MNAHPSHPFGTGAGAPDRGRDPVHDDRVGRCLEAAMRVVGGVVLLCLAAAWLLPVVAERRWPAPPAEPRPVHLRLDDPGTTATAVAAVSRQRR